MLDAFRGIRREIDSLSSALRRDRRVYVSGRDTLERIQELFLSWSTNVRPTLAGAGLPKEVLNHADNSFHELVRLTGRRHLRRQYLRLLERARQILVEQVLPEVAKIAQSQSGVASSLSGNLLPEIPDVPNELIPNALYGWIPNMRDFLRQNSFAHNVFLMFPYRPRISTLVDRIRRELRGFELNGIIAREHRLTDDLYNPLACLLCCNYGIAIFDRPEPRQMHNANIVYELGVMQLLKRKCLILKHDSINKLPSDFLQKLYEGYRTEEDALVRLQEWREMIARS